MPNGGVPLHMVIKPTGGDGVVYCRGAEVRVVPRADWDSRRRGFRYGPITRMGFTREQLFDRLEILAREGAVDLYATPGDVDDVKISAIGARWVEEGSLPSPGIPSVSAPEKLRLVILTSNPEGPRGETLWTEREVRDIRLAIRLAEHRERIDFQIRSSAQVQDVLDALNEVRPHLLHFSGHGSEAGIYVETDRREVDKLLTGELLTRAVSAVDEPPRVVVLNACSTARTGELLAHRVEAVVSMQQPITDSAAPVRRAALLGDCERTESEERGRAGTRQITGEGC